MNYWLLKSEPASYSIDDMKRDHTTAWTGVRNYQARNFMRDSMQKGDCAFFYHSGAGETAIVGFVEVSSKTAYPDPTQFDTQDSHFDPKATKEKPIWYLVDVKFKQKFKNPIALSVLKNDPFFKDMPLTKRGMRLSVQPVSKKHFDQILILMR